MSTSDRDQDPETQLIALRDFVNANGIEVHREYVDRAPANDLVHRTAWRELLDDAAKKRFKTVLVFKLDRAFRSVKHMHDTLSAWEMVGVGFQSMRENFETTTAVGRLMFEHPGLSGRVRVGADPRACEGGDGQGSPTGQADRASQGNGPARLRSSFWSYFGAPKLGRTIET